MTITNMLKKIYMQMSLKRKHDRPRFWSSEKCSGLELIISSARLSGVWLDSTVVWHSVKCIHSGVPSGTMYSQSSTGHLLSLNTVRDNNLRIAIPALVPFTPWLSAVSHNLFQPCFLAIFNG